MTPDHVAAEPPGHDHPSSAQSASPEPDPPSLADVLDRLAAEFEPALNRTTIARTVRRCRRELDIIHGETLPELLERLARQRLHAITTASIGERPAREP